MRERMGALRYLTRLFREVWKTSPALTSTSFGLRLVMAFQPILTFYIGKLIVDEIVSLTHSTSSGYNFTEWLMSGRLNRVGVYIGLELALTIGFDAVSRLVSLSDQFLSEKHNNRLSVALMAHAASLDLQHFESSHHQDQLERARCQACWSSNFLSQVFGQCENLMAFATLWAGLFAYAPLLILLLMVGLIPSVWNEMRFNAVAYKVNFDRAEARRQLDYLRYIGINAEIHARTSCFGGEIQLS